MVGEFGMGSSDGIERWDRDRDRDRDGTIIVLNEYYDLLLAQSHQCL
jgi:hypothetical protein